MDPKSFQNAITLLKDPIIINNINSNDLERRRYKIFLCYPKIISQRHKIHFIIDTNDIISFFSVAELTTEIQEQLKYEDVIVEVKRLFKQETFDTLFVNLTLYCIDNFENIKMFIKNNY